MVYLHVTSNEIIHISAILNCDSKKAFCMFTRNDYLESWLTNHAEVEPKLGGRYELFWNPSNRENDSTIGCRVISVVEPNFLSFTWKGPKQFKHFMNEVDPLTHVFVFFLPLTVQKGFETEVHLIHSGWRDSSDWQTAREYFVRNWITSLQNLESKSVTLFGM